MGDIADDNMNDIKVLSNGAEILDNDHIQRVKVKLDHRRFLLEISDPYKYGKRTMISGDVNAPLVPQLNEQQINDKLLEKMQQLKELGLKND